MSNDLPPPSFPLARNQDGAPFALPEGAAGWRVRRHTGGRPRIQLDAQKQPMRFPLNYSAADVEDILPPGTYRLDLVDGKGEPLGPTVPITVGQVDQGDEEASAASAQVQTAVPTTTSDTRLVLEANIQAMQLAFQHNQRTLELGLRMAETLRDSVYLLANAQADWIKSAAAARGAARPAMAPAPQGTASVAPEDRDQAGPAAPNDRP